MGIFDAFRKPVQPKVDPTASGPAVAPTDQPASAGQVPAAAPRPANIPGHIAGRLQTQFEPYGFKRQGQSWYRHTSGLTHIINLQASQHNDSRQGEFFVNVAVFHAKAYEINSGDPAPQYPKEYDAQLRGRIGQLGGTNTFTSWKYASDTDLNELSAVIGQSVINDGLPFFENIDTVRDLIEALETTGSVMAAGPYKHVQIAILYAILGEPIKARQEFEVYLHGSKKITDVVQMRVTAIADQAGIKLDIPELSGVHCVGFYFKADGASLVKDERKMFNKLLLLLGNFERKDGGFIHFYGQRRSPGEARIVYCTKNPAAALAYINDRKDSLPMSLSRVVSPDKP